MQGDVTFQRGLVAFDREVVVRATSDEVVGQSALRQQGVCGDVLAREVARCE
jgi:hypothetical protein